ncbi:Ankyrin repeat domain-containing protein 40 [Gryganskiella cystojenkinii]|nr:Ankyrin repeat domain-containing protein 40 [Gryganskiella cystojenkinii]
MAAIGNVKAVLHYCQSGVDVNAQNSMNKWTALHWAAHRGHEPVVRALLMRGARKDILNNKDQTPADLAKKPEICALFGKEVEVQGQEQDDANKPAFVPAYLAQPDLSKLWSMPDGSTDDPRLNQEAFALSNPNIPATTPVPVPRTGLPPVSSPSSTPVAVVSSTTDSHAAKEILVYNQTVTDDNLLGAIFANVEDTIERTIELIKDEMDEVPEQFNVGRFNGSKTIPVNTKQYGRKTGDFFKGDGDAIVLLVKSA